MVAPISVIVPFSTTGRKPSCWARLKRWISSTNSNVPWPVRRRRAASSNARFRSATPENTAESCTKCSPERAASSRAIVVLPQPGGPQRISEASEPARQHARQRAVGTEQMVLADDLVECARTQPVGQRARTGRRSGFGVAGRTCRLD